MSQHHHRLHIGTTLTNYLVTSQRNLNENEGKAPTGRFTALILDVCIACKKIADLVKRGALIGVLGSAKTSNVQGEEQKTMDVLSNDLFIESLTTNKNCAALVSEELDDVHQFPANDSPYLIVCDPLDGSSNIDVNVSVGTIFGVLERTGDVGTPVTKEEFFQPSKRQVASAMCVYGPSVCLFLNVGVGQGVQQFVLDHDIGEFILVNDKISIPKCAFEYAINASNRRHWPQVIQKWVADMEQGKEGPLGKDYNMRWVASAVAEVQRILTRGGVWTYPLDRKLEKQGKSGRIRILYEVGPLGMLVTEAGGRASVLPGDALDFVPSALHQRVPVMLGSADNVELLEKRFLEK